MRSFLIRIKNQMQIIYNRDSLISISSFWYPRYRIRLWPCFCVINVISYSYIVDSSEGIFILCIIFVFNDFCFIGQVVPDNKYIHTYIHKKGCIIEKFIKE